ncbi:MAG TPA: TonB-dependent receptor [Steroidobacteraceae bacterium]|nr:TonB-dependent receptor [Steroidobacteraceae bacterium]
MNDSSRARSRTLTLCIALALSAAAQAQDAVADGNLADLSIEELMQVRVDSVYGASKHEQKVTQAPSSVTIVTAEEIRRFGYRTLADVLRGVRGFYVSDDRNYQYVGVRGFLRPGDYNSRILLTIDGHRMNDSIYDGAYAGREGVIDLELVERIEVIRGPSSSLYGSSAFFGVINVITKRGGQFGGVEVAGEGATSGTHKERATYGARYANGLEWLVSGSQYQSDGAARLYYPEFDQRISEEPRASNNGIAADIDSEDAVSVFTKVSYGSWSLGGYFNDRNKQVPTASFDTIFNDPREQTRDRRGYLELGYDRHLSDALDLQARVYYDDYLYRGTYPYDLAAPGDPSDPVMYRDAAIGKWFGTEWQLTARLADTHTLQVGGEYRDNRREYQDAYYDIEPRSYDLQTDGSSDTLGVYVQDEIRLHEKLAVTAGLRLDRYSDNFGSTLNPRMGVIYSASPTATFKALYGQAFRAPNAFERFYNPEQANQPELKPETIKTYELVYEQYFGHRYRVGASAYYYDVNELITQTQTGLGDQYFANLDEVRALGLELEAEGRFDSGTRLAVSYTLQRARDDVSGRELSSSPRHLAKAHLTVPLYAQLLASLELQYNGASRTIRAARADDFLLANLTLLGEQLLPGLEVSVGVFNLLDAHYGYPGSADNVQDIIEQNGRSVQGKITYRF